MRQLGTGYRRAPGESFTDPFWSALAVFRVAALIYGLALIWHSVDGYRHPVAAWIAGGVVAVWTVIAIMEYRIPSRRRWPLLITDLVVMSGCLLASVPIIGNGPIRSAHSLPGLAVAGAVMAWAIAKGRLGAAVASTVIGLSDLYARGVVNQNSVNNYVLLLISSIAIGYVATLGVEAQARLERAVEAEAVARERNRLARDIHDSVLQVLSLVARRAEALGGEAAALGRLAGEQEAALRALIRTAAGIQPVPAGARTAPAENRRRWRYALAGTVPEPAGDVLPGDLATADLRPLLHRYASQHVTIVAPATEVTVAWDVAAGLTAAAGCALDNVRLHVGEDARAWVLIEDDPAAVTVTVRDDGPGIPAGRLDEAASAGRLGVAESIRGRVRDLGGSVSIVSAPGQGTEVEMRVPRVRP